MSRARHGLVPGDYDVAREGEKLRITGVECDSSGGMLALRAQEMCRLVGVAFPKK